MEETSCSVATTPSPVPTALVSTSAVTATTTTPSAISADVFSSPSAGQAQSCNQQPVRILGRNVNGTVVQTSMPQNEAELQLYRVMQKASLLSYYDTLLEMGGDDVQQLCDAGEEEFLEIMALVGMASKPLHVRRLQKALQDWLTNPGMFQTPVLAPTATSTTSATQPNKSGASPAVFPCIGSYSPTTRQQIASAAAAAGSISTMNSASSQAAAKLHSPSLVSGLPTVAATPPIATPIVQTPAAQILGHFSSASNCCPIQRRKTPSPNPSGFGSMQIQNETAQASPSNLTTNLPLAQSPGLMQTGNYESSSCGSQGTTPSPNSNSGMLAAPQSPTFSFHTTPVLLESQVQRLAEAAERLAATLRPPNPKPPSGIKKKMCKNLEMVMAMPDSDPRRMEEIRKYAAIYGRFDCKRKPEKPLTLHEVSVNEAAAQICRFIPTLLTRRDELFPLARKVVRDSGHYYTKSLLHSSSMSRDNGDGGDLSGCDESSLPSAPTTSSTTTAATTTTTSSGMDAAKRRKLEEDSVAGNRDILAESTHQAETTRLRCSNFARNALNADSDSNSMQIHHNRHRKRQRRRRLSRFTHKSISSPLWQSCNESNNMVLDGVVDGLEDSDGCYTSYDDEWDDCNEDECENDFGIDTDEGARDDGDDDIITTSSMLHERRNQEVREDDDVSCMVDKENDFNLKVIASCGDNIIAVANPALMNRNQSAPITKESPIKEEIALRDRRD